MSQQSLVSNGYHNNVDIVTLKTLTTTTSKEYMYSRFPRNSASEILESPEEVLPWYYIHSNMSGKFKTYNTILLLMSKGLQY